MLEVKTIDIWKTFVIGLVILGIFLRVYRVIHTQFFYGDPALDMLVAVHLVEEESPPLVKPFAVGGQGILPNSPLYFQVLATTYRVVRNYQYIVYLFSLTGILCIPLAYLIGKEAEDKRLGCVLAGMTAVSFPFIYMSRLVWQPNLIPFITFLSLYFLIKARKTSSLFFLAASFGVSVFGLYLHHNFAPFFIGLNLMYILLLVDHLRQKHYRSLLALVLYVIALVAIWKQLYIPHKTEGVLSIFQLNFSNLLRWPEVIQVILRRRFFYLAIFESYFLNLALLLCALLGLWKYLQRYNFLQKDSFFPKMLLVLLLTSLLPAFYSGNLRSHYLTPYFVLATLLIGLFIYYCFARFRKLFWFTLILYALLNIQPLSQMKYIFTADAVDELEYEQLIHQEIVADYRKRTHQQQIVPSRFAAMIIDSNNYGRPEEQFGECVDCTTSSQYLLLEKSTGRHFTKLTPDPMVYNNIVSLNTNPEYFYLVCRLEKMEFKQDKKKLLTLAEKYCLPRTNIFNSQTSHLVSLRRQAITGPSNFGNAVLFVLQRQPRAAPADASL